MKSLTRSLMATSPSWRPLMALDELDVALVLLRRFTGGDRPEVVALAGPRVDLLRIEAILPAAELANHDALLFFSSAAARPGFLRALDRRCITCATGAAGLTPPSSCASPPTSAARTTL